MDSVEGQGVFVNLLAAVRHWVSDPCVVVLSRPRHNGVVEPWFRAKGVGVLATGLVLPAHRTPAHPLLWLGVWSPMSRSHFGSSRF